MKKNLVMTLTVLATISEVSGMRELLQQGVGDISTESNSSVGEASSGLIGNYEDIWAQYETSIALLLKFGAKKAEGNLE